MACNEQLVTVQVFTEAEKAHDVAFVWRPPETAKELTVSTKKITSYRALMP